MGDGTPKSLGQAIDQIIDALRSLEGPAQLVAIKAACDAVGIAAPGASTRNGGAGAKSISSPSGAIAPSDPVSPPAPESASGPQQLLDIRTFAEQKKPRNSPEMACVAAYYLAALAPEEDRRASINTADLERLWGQARVLEEPRRIDQVLPDARAAGYFDSVGRGTYRLNSVGRNLVLHRMPRAHATDTPKRHSRAARGSVSKGAKRDARKGGKVPGRKASNTITREAPGKNRRGTRPRASKK